MTLRSARRPSATTPRIAQPDGAGGRAGQLRHHPADRHAAVAAVAGPMRERVRGEARVGDDAHVGAAVAQPEDGVGVRQHLAAGLEVAVREVGERHEQEVAAVVLRQEVECELGGVHRPAPRPSAARSSRAPARSRAPRPAGTSGRSRRAGAGTRGGRPPSRRRARRTGSRSAATCASSGCAGDLLEGGVAREGMERRLQPQEEPDRSRRHLGPDGQPVGRRLLNLGQQAAPRLGPLVALRQRHRQRAPGALDQPPDQRELARRGRARSPRSAPPRRGPRPPRRARWPRARPPPPAATASGRRSPCGGSASATSRSRWRPPAWPRWPAGAWPPRPPASPPPGGRPAHP